MTNLDQIWKEPSAFLKRVILKKLVAPLKYSSKKGYNAPAYWEDRFRKYGTSIRGPGHEGLSEAENERMYREAAGVFRAICRKEMTDFQTARVLEIGVGTGFYTRLLQELGAQSYTGIDITDVLFSNHAKIFPSYRFRKADITEDILAGSFNVIVMIDVMQHIVEKKKLAFAMENLKRSLAPGGIFIVGPLAHVTKKHLFYVHYWSKEILKEFFGDFKIGEAIPFRNGEIVVIKKMPM